jgi:hypothetical protein
VYLEREEGVTPGVWPSAKYQKMKPPVTKTPKVPKVAATVKAAEEPAKMKAKSSALRTRRVVSEEQPPRAVVSRVSELAKFRAAKEAKVPVQQVNEGTRLCRFPFTKYSSPASRPECITHYLPPSLDACGESTKRWSFKSGPTNAHER